MNTYEKLKHTTWKCKYYVVFIPKYRRKGLFLAVRKGLGIVFHELFVNGNVALKKDYDGGACPHVDIDSIEVLGISNCWLHKGKSAIHIARRFIKQGRHFMDYY